jgi:hypothetical protein
MDSYSVGMESARGARVAAATCAVVVVRTASAATLDTRWLRTRDPREAWTVQRAQRHRSRAHYRLGGRSAERSAPKWQTEKSKTEKVEAHCPTETMGGGMVVPG